MTRLGVMGGTFDPVHWAHLVVGEEAWMRFRLDKVIFVPAGQPAHRAVPPVANPEHRYAMTLLATATNPAFEVSRIEIDHGGPSYSIRTVRALKEIYGPETQIFFIVGADEAFELPSWYEAEGLIQLAKFIAVPRPGFDLKKLERQLPKHFYDAIELLPMPPIDISATSLRARVEAGESIRYLVPDAVHAYICKHGLYLQSVSL